MKNKITILFLILITCFASTVKSQDITNDSTITNVVINDSVPIIAAPVDSVPVVAIQTDSIPVVAAPISTIVSDTLLNQPRRISETRNIELKLQNFRRQSLTGIWMTIVGSGIAIAASTISSEGSHEGIKTPLMISGAMIAVIGFGIELSAYGNLRFKQNSSE